MPQERYDEIARRASDGSSVGIDAKKTDILILRLLLGIERCLTRLEGLEIRGAACDRQCVRVGVQNPR